VVVLNRVNIHQRFEITKAIRRRVDRLSLLDVALEAIGSRGVDLSVADPENSTLTVTGVLLTRPVAFHLDLSVPGVDAVLPGHEPPPTIPEKF